jgi:pimeloyl-ACP methyl ester carboxylesterase
MNQFKSNYETKKNSAAADIFFVHGNLASRRWWYPVAELLLKEQTALQMTLNKTMLMSDLRGCGLTPNPTPGKMNLDDLVADQIQIAEQAQFKNALVVGHSAGGLITALMLARRPDLFKAALLIDPVGPTGLLGVPDDIEAKYDMMAASRDIAAQVISFTIHGNDAEKPFFKNEIMDDSMTALKNTGIDLVRALQNIDYSSEISKVKQPVMIYHGAHDWVLDQSRATDHQKLMKNSQFVNLPNNGHCMNYENPERLAIDICNFIKENLSVLA